MHIGNWQFLQPRHLPDQFRGGIPLHQDGADPVGREYGHVLASYSADGTDYHRYYLTVKTTTPDITSTAVWRVYRDGVEVITYTGAGSSSSYTGLFAGHYGTTGTGTWRFDWIAGRDDGAFTPAQWDPVVRRKAGFFSATIYRATASPVQGQRLPREPRTDLSRHHDVCLGADRRHHAPRQDQPDDRCRARERRQRSRALGPRGRLYDICRRSTSLAAN